MPELKLFIDGSVGDQSKVGYGAYLALSDPDLPLSTLKKQIRVKRFEQTSSTKLELQTLLWALSEIQTSEDELTVYTDSQNIIGLPGRRNRLEQNNYHSSKNILLNNYELYQHFYRWLDQRDCQFVKVPGHQQAKKKNMIELLFSLVDKASRKALREDNH